jgi:1-deoxy-D-xylulose-5-phosphate synthase
MEDHSLENGFGTAVLEHLSESQISTPVVRIGWPDQFIEHGTVPILRAKHGLTVENTVSKIVEALQPKDCKAIDAA